MSITDECIEWDLSLDGNGYGSVTHQGRSVKAHRLYSTAADALEAAEKRADEAEAREREACAKVCDDEVDAYWSAPQRAAADWCAKRIRPRGKP